MFKLQVFLFHKAELLQADDVQRHSVNRSWHHKFVEPAFGPISGRRFQPCLSMDNAAGYHDLS